MPKEQYKLKILAPARKITETLRKSIEHIRDYPYLGVALEERNLSQLGYRKLVSGDYLCFYRLIGNTIFVYHIADGRTEYKRLFCGFPTEE